MAVNQNKHSSSRVQGSRRSTHDSTKPAAPKPQTSVRKHRNPKKPKKEQPSSLRFTETRRGKTTVRHFSGRSFYRFEEVKGKIVDYVQIFTAGEYHSIDIRFQDKTALHFVIDPGFTLDTEYGDWKTGELRRIKHWPLIKSQTHRA